MRQRPARQPSGSPRTDMASPIVRGPEPHPEKDHGQDHGQAGEQAAAHLRVIEMFGPTLQGEGVAVGQAAQFLRLDGCNLTCAWCDTAYAWDNERRDPERPATSMSISNILGILDPRTRTNSRDAELKPPPPVTRLVITGGEPLLQAGNLSVLTTSLHELGWTIEVETSGTVSPVPLTATVDRFTVSPKLAHSGVAERARIRPAVLAEFAALDTAVFKFVVKDVDDLDDVDTLLATHTPSVASHRVWVMAEGTTSDVVLERSRVLADGVLGRGWNLTPRWHTLLWEDEPGR